MPKEPTLKELIKEAKALGIDYTEMNYDEMLEAVTKAKQTPAGKKPKKQEAKKTKTGEAKTPPGDAPKAKKKKPAPKPEGLVGGDHWNKPAEPESAPSKPAKTAPKATEKPRKAGKAGGKTKTIKKPKPPVEEPEKTPKKKQTKTAKASGKKTPAPEARRSPKKPATKPKTKTIKKGDKGAEKPREAVKKATKDKGQTRRGRPFVDQPIPKGNPFREDSTAAKILEAVQEYGKEGAIKHLDKSKLDFGGKPKGPERTAYIRFRVYCTLREANARTAKKGKK